jgi:RNA polymerase sigma-70 factor (ECF subfamily)
MATSANQPRAGITDPTRWTDDYGDSLYAFALARIGDASLAEDLVQDTFLAGIAAIGRFRRESSLLTWLTGILRRKIADELRFRRRRSVEQSAEIDRSTSRNSFNRRGKWAQTITAWRVDPQEIAQTREFWESFEKCIAELPHILAAAFRLRQLDGLKTQEVCSTLQISDANLAVRMHRARLSLRDCLERNWFRMPKEMSRET